MRKILIIIIVLAGLGLAAGALLMADMKQYAKTPVHPQAVSAKPVIFSISPGDSFRTVTRRLEDAGLICSPFRFRLLARYNGQDKQIKTGEYRLTPGQSPAEILATLVDGKIILYRLTIPEGYTLRQIAHSVAAAGLASADDFLRAANDPELIGSLAIDAPSLEGYLFPDTYYFPRTVTPSAIIRTMVRRLNAVFTPAWKTAAKEKGLTVHQVLTLASIIEKETGDPGERALISSVFHNRLKKGMRLESDPTVIYGISGFDGNLTRRHLRTPGPYNTYLNTGLPPGPIASPGAAAIKAVLFPEKTPYLFFVARKDGTHQFSTHYAAHQRAVRKYQLNRQ
ncbi:MAG: endolytic transglycosylase MltG [Deltaproteobacteria bacterium]|nr:MAG: endolytic transglycosylase MltG [Deltaproteobacteria bacterium]